MEEDIETDIIEKDINENIVSTPWYDDNEIRQKLFLILMVIFIITLIITITIFIKYKNLIVTDPLTYGMELHNFQSCTCIDNQSMTWYSYEGGFINANPINFQRGVS